MRKVRIPAGATHAVTDGEVAFMFEDGLPPKAPPAPPVEQGQTFINPRPPATANGGGAIVREAQAFLDRMRTARMDELLEGREVLPREVSFRGLELRERRRAANLEQAELGEMLGLTGGSAVSAWECGRAQPRVSVLDKLCTLWGVPRSTFLELVGKQVATAG